MTLPEKAQVLRIFIGESDKLGRRPLYEAIISEARRRKLAGATAIRGVLGFGAESHMHTAKILRLSEDLPMVVEIVDHPEKIQEFLPYVDEHVKEGLVLIEDVRVIFYGAHRERVRE